MPPAVVTNANPANAWLLAHERNCLLYEPVESAQALADAVRRLGDDPALRARLRAAGSEKAARYTERAYNEAIRRALERCTG